MNTNITAITVRTLLVGATAACTLIASSAVARDRDVTISIPVSTRGLDVTHASGAQELYTRIRRAADLACTRANQVGLAPVYDEKECVESAVGNAVRSANMPQLTQAYLGNHTPREATARAIEAPAQLATK